jgi:hypothetical protein
LVVIILLNKPYSVRQGGGLFHNELFCSFKW